LVNIESVITIGPNGDLAAVSRALPGVDLDVDIQVDVTVARFWGLPIETPLRQRLRLLDGGGARIRLVAGAAPATVLRYETRDIVELSAQHRTRGTQLTAPLQIVRLPPYGVARAFAISAPNGVRLEFFERGARPMPEHELREFARLGRYSTWVRFNGQLTGNVLWRADGTARVRWQDNRLDEEGTWAIRGDAVCTAWKRLRGNRELCVQHYRLDGDRTQSFQRDGTPDGVHDWLPPGQSGP
jgi:hypothetical protein